VPAISSSASIIARAEAKSTAGIARERLHEKVVPREVHVGAQRRHERRLVRQDGVQSGRLALDVEERLPHQHLPEDEAHRVQVGPLVDRLVLDRLGREVMQVPPHRPRLRRRRAAQCAGHAEVDDLHFSRPRDEDVLGTQVAVHDAQQPSVGSSRGVCVREPSEYLASDVAGDVGAEPAPRSRAMREERRERHAESSRSP
jgi:hypothetical protein